MLGTMPGINGGEAVDLLEFCKESRVLPRPTHDISLFITELSPEFNLPIFTLISTNVPRGFGVLGF